MRSPIFTNKLLLELNENSNALESYKDIEKLINIENLKNINNSNDPKVLTIDKIYDRLRTTALAIVEDSTVSFSNKLTEIIKLHQIVF